MTPHKRYVCACGEFFEAHGAGGTTDVGNVAAAAVLFAYHLATCPEWNDDAKSKQLYDLVGDVCCELGGEE